MNIAISDSFDELARMVAAGFKETNGMVYQLQSDFNGLQGELHGFRNEVHGRFDSFEETVATNHGHRLRRIETKLQLA